MWCQYGLDVTRRSARAVYKRVVLLELFGRSQLEAVEARIPFSQDLLDVRDAVSNGTVKADE